MTVDHDEDVAQIPLNQAGALAHRLIPLLGFHENGFLVHFSYASQVIAAIPILHSNNLTHCCEMSTIRASVIPR